MKFPVPKKRKVSFKWEEDMNNEVEAMFWKIKRRQNSMLTSRTRHII